MNKIIMSDKKKNPFGTIVRIGDCLVSEDVVTEFFACDYEKCHGQCCVVGDSGAPLKEDEIEKIEAEYDKFSSLMTPEGIEATKLYGFFEVDIDGDYVTPTIKIPHRVEGLDYIPGAENGVVGTSGLGDCAYIHYQNTSGDSATSCFCSIERCHCEGGCSFRKPISCWLYPIRITKLSNGTDALNLHRWSICSDAYIKGKRDNIRVYQFLEKPLTSLYGEEFYNELCAAADYINQSEQ